MSSKNRRPKYDDDYVKLAISFAAFSRSPISNRNFAKHIGVSESVIRKWRKEKVEFDKAFLDPEILIANKVNKGLLSNIEKREKITIVESADGVKSIKEDILPTHQDYIAVSKMGFRKTMIGFTEQHRKVVLFDLNKRINQGELSYIDAVSELEIEEIPVPLSWKAREIKRIVNLKKSGKITPLDASQILEGEGIAVPKTLLLEVLDQLKRPMSFEKDEAAKIDVSNFTVEELKSLLED